jgi:HEAT repeat protein
VDALIAALRDEDEWVCWQAAAALGAIGDRRALEPLMAAFQTDNWAVRKKAADAIQAIAGSDLGYEFPPEAVEKPDDAHVQWWAAQALRAIDPALAAEPLIAALATDEDFHVRCWAAGALGEIRTAAAMDALIAALADEHAAVRESAWVALRDLTDEIYGPEPEQWQQLRDEMWGDA